MIVTVSDYRIEKGGQPMVSCVARLDGLPEGQKPPFEETRVFIPLAAIANRMEVYGLATHQEALRAIMREHAQRWMGLAPEPFTTPEPSGKGKAGKWIWQDAEKDDPAPSNRAAVVEWIKGKQQKAWGGLRADVEVRGIEDDLTL
jgi:hypothetical protein